MAAYRRVTTMIFVPAHSHQASSIEMLVINPVDLEAAQQRDAETQEPTATTVEAMAVAGQNRGPA